MCIFFLKLGFHWTFPGDCTVGTSLGRTTRGILGGFPGRVLSATPWRDRAKASSMGRAPDLLRSESLRMDETGSKESQSPSAFEPFLFNSSALEEGGSTLYAGGFQTVIGMTSNGCSVALPEESFAFAAEPE